MDNAQDRMMARPPTGIPSRPPTHQNRSMTAMSRPSTFQNFSRSSSRQSLNSPFNDKQYPRNNELSRPSTESRSIGTASRLATALAQKPMSQAGIGVGLVTPVNVVDRPITHHGLTGLKTGQRPSTRQVQDKSYFMGMLRTKISELVNEIKKLSREIEVHRQEQANSIAYEKRVKEMAIELTDLRGELANYNLLVDLLNTETDVKQIEEDSKKLAEINTREEGILDDLFSEKQEKEKMVMELEMERHPRQSDSQIESMSPEMRKRYFDVRNQFDVFTKEIDSLQQQLDLLDSRNASFEDELSLSQVKKEAFIYLERIQETEEKLENLIREVQSRGSPSQEPQKLLNQVKDDNNEIATMERSLNDINIKKDHLQEEINHLNSDLEESQSEKSQKYRELKKREITMDQFLNEFDENKTNELKRLSKMEQSNIKLLEKISRNLNAFGNLPNITDLHDMKEDLLVKESELAKSQGTAERLIHERKALHGYLQKIEALEGKVKQELETLKSKKLQMIEDLDKYSDMNSLKIEEETKKQKVGEELTKYLERCDKMRLSVNAINKEYEDLKGKLAENETYAQLINLERKLTHLEQNNFSVKEYLAQKESETDYSSHKTSVINCLHDYNIMLQEMANKKIM